MPNADEPVVTRTSLQRRKLRHGFKAEAKRRTIKVRRAHGLGDYDPLDCFELARCIGVKVYRVSEFPTDHAHHLIHTDPGAFSAATLRFDGHHGVLLNDSHADERQASNLAHELGHVLLEHEEFPPLNDHGCREHDADLEAEAEYFGSVLLVTDAAVMNVARAGTAIDVAAAKYGVSKQMMQWRYNDCGARRRLERERRR
jgi:hypothetical protein